MFSKTAHTIGYIYCVPDIACDLNLHGTDPILTSKELISAICQGNKNRFVIISSALQTLEKAEQDAQAWNKFTTNIKDNFWLIKIDMSPSIYQDYRSKYGFICSLGIFLNPIKDHITHCINATGSEVLTEKDLQLQAPSRCLVM